MSDTRENVLEALRHAKAQMIRDLERDDQTPPEYHLRTALAYSSGRLKCDEPAISDELWSMLEIIHNAGF